MYDEDELYQTYQRFRPDLERLGNCICDAIIRLLEESNIDVLDVTFRIKEFSSYLEKLKRKQCEPSKAIDDLCGVRIIAYYPSDVHKIDCIIRREFHVLESENKQRTLLDDQFGYRSQHYLVMMPKAWASSLNFVGSVLGLDEYFAEIQLRTVLMHAWAGLSHKLVYKDELQIPQEFRRRVNRLSALLELADEQFERLREEGVAYRQRFTQETLCGPRGLYDISEPLNFDSLKAFLEHYFSDRWEEDIFIVELLEQLMPLEISLLDIERGYESVCHLLSEHEVQTYPCKKKVG